MTLAHLEAFLQVAEHGSFRGASRALGLSQPALSRTIKIAEAVLGAQLFDRHKQKARLTASGQQLVPIARRVLGEFDDSLTELGRFIHGGAGRVTIAILPSAAIWLLPDAIASFRKESPEVVFVLKDNIAAVLLDELSEGSADFAVTISPTATDVFAFTPLITDQFVLVCRHDDPLAGTPTLSWSEFAGGLSSPCPGPAASGP